MAASRSDMNLLGTDGGFQGRVRAALILACVNIAGEGFAVPFHKQRAEFAAQILNAPDQFKPLFASSAATDLTVVGDATAAGTVVLAQANLAAQAALVTDGHIDNAIAAEFNAFIQNLV